MNKKVLFFAQQIHAPWIEGVKNNSIKICEELNKRLQVDIISHKGPHNSLDSDVIKGVTVHYLLKLHDNKFLQAFYFISGAFKSLFFILQNKPSKIFIQYLDTSYLLVIIFIKLFVPKTDIVLVLYSTDEVNIGYKKLFLKYIRFDKIVIISQYLRSQISELGYRDDDIVYIPLSYNKTRFLDYQEPSKRKSKKVLFSAGPIRQAGSFFMVDLAEIMPDYQFVFAMRKFNKKSEDQLDILRRYINKKGVKNIEIKRNIDRMEELLGDISAFVLPLQDINVKMLVPVSLLEAMARGTNCFVSDLGNLKKLIDDTENAIVFDKNNIHDLKDKIIQYQGTKDLGKKAHKFAADYPDLQDIVDSYYKLI